MIDITKEGGPMQACRLSLLSDGFPPVEGLEDSLMLEHESAVGELRGQADDESAEHVAAAWSILVGHEVAVARVDVQVIELGGKGGRVLRHELAADLPSRMPAACGSKCRTEKAPPSALSWSAVRTLRS